MPIDFRLASLEVENFRGIRSLEIEFFDETPTYLVGGNNSGKSTLLIALALVLKGGGFHRFSPHEFDFFRDSQGQESDNFSVSLRFDAETEKELPAVQRVGNPESVYGARVTGRAYKSGRRQHTHSLFGKNGEGILLSPRTALRGETKEKYKDHDLGWKHVYAKPDDIRSNLPEVWRLTADNLYRSLYEWKTGPLQRLSRILSDRFLKDKWEFEHNEKTCKMPKTMTQIHGFFKEAIENFPFWKDDMKAKVESAMTKYIGSDACVSLRPDIRTLEEWLTQQLAVSFAADSGGALTPLDRMGEGWQSLIRIAALDVLREYAEDDRRVILLFEEPETYLHPHLRRKLRDVFADLAKKGWMVVCSTHAPEFVSFSQSQVVVRLWRRGDDVEKGVLHTDSVSSAAKFQEKLDERGNHELLFANRVILCEGKDDAYAVRLFLEKAKTDIDGKSVTILDLGGVENLPDYAEMSQQLGIPWCGLTDEDKEANGLVKQKTVAVRKSLTGICGENDIMPIWPGSLERVFRITDGQKANPEWQHANIENLEIETLKVNYPDYASTCESIRSWIDS